MAADRTRSGGNGRIESGTFGQSTNPNGSFFPYDAAITL